MRQRILDRLAVASWALAAFACGCLLLHGVAAAQDAPPPSSEATPSAGKSGAKSPAPQMKVVVYRLQHARSAAVIGVLAEVLDYPGAKISPGDGDKTIIVWGPEEVHERMKELLNALDVPELDETPEFCVYPVNHADPQSVMKVLLEVLDLPVSKMAVDERNKTIIVSGPPKTNERVEQLIEELDVPEPGETTVLRVYRLKQADPAMVGKTLANLLTGIGGSMEIDQRTRSVMIAAPLEVHRRVEELLEELDRPVEQEDGKRTEIFTLKHADPASVRMVLAGFLGKEFPDTRVLDDKRLNSILFSGSDAALARAAELIDQLDVPARFPESRQVKVFRLQYAEAGELADVVVSALGPESSVAVDDRTNSILATGPEEELEVVEAVLLRLDQEAGDHRQEAVPAACQVRIVWLIGPMTDGGATPSEDLTEVVDELAGIGIKDLRQVAQTLVNTQVGGEFKLHCSPALNDQLLSLTISGNVTQRESTPILSIQILAESPVETGAAEGSSGGMRPLIDLETEIAAPYGHYVVLSVAPVGEATSAFVVQIVPGKK